MDRTAARLGACADALAALPAVIAGPLHEWAHEDDPRMALWHACDAVEMTLRLAVALGVGDWAAAGGVPPGLRLEIARRLEQPTLGRWRGMAMALAAQSAPATALADLWTWLTGALEPLLDPPGEATVATSLTALRNRLAHGGGVPQALAAELIARWEPPLAATFGGLAMLRDVRLVAPGSGVVLGPADPAALAIAEAWAATRPMPPDAVVAVRGALTLPLWPLVAFASPPGEPRAVPQVYVRRGEVRLVMTPLGAERAAAAESSDDAVAALLAAGLLGDPPPRPPVALEIAGFDKELSRDAGQCTGRDAEAAAIVAALRGGPALAWIVGPAGSGKSLVIARAVRDLAAIDGAPAALVFRFRAGDGRCTRDTFLRFVVERAAGLAGEAPARGKPLREQARALLATLGGRVVVVVDGVDDIVAIDPGIVAETLAPLARVTRLVAAGRPDAAVVAAMAAAAAIPVFEDGLPPMSVADVRAMLLDKIGPLSKRLVALDRDRGRDAVVNPFVDAVVARAAGLPVYVAYVIGDVLAGRVLGLDAAALPPSLGAYHAEVLRRGGAGAAQQLVTPLVAMLAIAREPLDAAALHALLVRRVLATDDALGHAAVGEALAQLAGLVHRIDDDDRDDGRFALFHPTLRDHVLGAADQAMAVTTARQAMAAAARAHLDDAARPYLDDHGVDHLVELGDLDGAAAALSWPRVLARLGRGPAALPGVLADLARVPAVAELAGFVRGAAHHLERGGVAALIQAALADGDDSPVTAAAEAQLAATPRPGLLRRIDRPARRRRGARQRTMVGHGAALRGLTLVDDALISASADGTLRAWDAGDGSLLRVLALPPSAMSMTTRAAPPAAPLELAGAMPVLGVHAVCALPGGRVAAAHGDGVVRLWDVEAGACLAEARLRTYVWGLAVAGDRVVCAGDDGALRVLDAGSLASLATVDVLAAAHSGDGAPYLAACASVAGALVVGGRSRGLAIVDPGSGAHRGELRGHEAAPRALAAVPGTSWLLSTSLDGTVALWDVAARRLLGRAAVPGGAWSVTAASASLALVGARSGELSRLTLPDLDVVRTARVHAGAIAAVVALADGRAATAGDDKAVRLVDLDVAAAARPSHAGAITALAAAAHLVVSGGDDGAIKIWDAAGGRSLRTVPAHAVPISAVAAATIPGGVAAFSAAGAAVTEHRLTATGAIDSHALPPSPSPVLALAAAGPDQLLAACADGAVRAWTRAGGWQPPRHRHDAAALALALAGSRVVSGGADSMVRTSDDAAAGEQRWRGHAWDVHAVAVAADLVVSAARDGAIIVWGADGAPRLELSDHGGAPRCLAVSPDGARVASATRDDQVRLWRASDGVELARWTCDAPPTALVFADADTLVIGDAAGELTVLR